MTAIETLYRIAHNRLIDHYRRRPQGVPESYDDADGPRLELLEAADHERPEIRYEAGRQIEELRRLGRHAEADKNLAEFKKRYPEYPLPAHPDST